MPRHIVIVETDDNQCDCYCSFSLILYPWDHLFQTVLKKKRPLLVKGLWTGKNMLRTGGWETLNETIYLGRKYEAYIMLQYSINAQLTNVYQYTFKTDVRRNIHFMACNSMKCSKSAKDRKSLKICCFLNSTKMWHPKRICYIKFMGTENCHGKIRIW
jgi:hypothetical protein